MAENQVEITQNKGYNNIDLTRMSNGDTIVVEKKYDTVRKLEGEKDYGDGPKKWVMYSAGVEYNGQDVSFIMKKTHSNDDKIINPEDYVAVYDALGGQGTKVRITCTKGMGPAVYDFKPVHKKGDDIVKTDFTFEVVE